MSQRVATCLLLVFKLALAQAVWAQPAFIAVDDDNTTGNADGSPLHPYPRIQAAIDAAASGDHIAIAAGQYGESLEIIEKSLTLQGGYPGGSTADYANGTSGSFITAQPERFDSHIQGQATRPVIRLQGEMTADTILAGLHISGGKQGIVSDEGPPIDRLTIHDCFIEGNGGANHVPLGGSFRAGAGIRVDGGDGHVITNNRIEGNSAPYDPNSDSLNGWAGGASFAAVTGIDITNNTFINNTAYGNHGGGLALGDSTGNIANNVFQGNRIGEGTGYGWGGGLFLFGEQTDVEVSDCVLRENFSVSRGGGFFVDDGATATLRNSLVINNSSEDGAGGIYVEGLDESIVSYLTVVNSTIADNLSQSGNPLFGDGMFIENASVTVTNAIFWDNGNGSDFVLGDGPSSSLSVDYTLSQQVWPGGTGNRHDDPLFVDPAKGDYHLRSTAGYWDSATRQWLSAAVDSPALDRGDPASAFDREPLPNGGRINLGAYGNTAEASRSGSLEQVTLTVIVDGAGQVTGEGINCPGDCTETYHVGTLVELRQLPAQNQVFAGWSGACMDSHTFCSFALDQQQTVTARFTAQAGGGCSLDIDGNGSVETATDGILLLRALFGFTGNALRQDAVGAGASRSSAAAIAAYIDECMAAFDIDANGQTDALSDGVVVMRYLSGRSGEGLVQGAVDSNGQRVTGTAVGRYLQEELDPRETPVAANCGNSLIEPLFPADYPWNQRIGDAALDAQSSAIIGFLDSNHDSGQKFRIDGPSEEANNLYGMTLLVADADTAAETFLRKEDEHWLPDCDTTPVPIPANGAIEGQSGYACDDDGDCHLLVLDTAACRLYEMWRADRPDAEAFEGGCLAVWDLNQAYTETLRGDCCTSADAAGLSIAALMFGPDEIAAGEIKHALRFILPNNLIRQRIYVHPATHSTGATSGPDNAPPYGARLRLRADFDMERLNPAAQVVARALQQYGMFLADGGNLTFTALNDRFTEHRWAEVGMGPNDLTGLDWSDFEVVELGERLRWDAQCNCERVPLTK